MRVSLVKFCKENWFIILVTLLAAYLRLYRLEASLQFLGDQGRDALVMYQIFAKRDLPFIGPITSVGGFYLGPLYYYLMAPFLLLWRFNPAGPAFATAIIGIITIPVLYFVAQKLFSLAAARWTSLLYALAVIPISETRSAWNPNPMPLAALGLLYGLYLANYQKKPQGLILAAVSLAIALQLHYMIVFLAPFLLWQLLLAWRQSQSRKYLVLSLMIILLFLSPLILFEIKNNFLNSRGLWYFLNQHQYQKLDLYQNFLNLRGRSEEVIGMVLGFGRGTNLTRTLTTRLMLLATALVLLKNRRPGFIITSLWLLLSIAALAFFQSNVYPHYLGFLFPLVFIILGYFLSHFEGKLFPLALAFFLMFAWINLPLVSQVLAINGNLKTIKQTAKFIRDDINLYDYQNYNLVLLDDTRDYKAMNVRYFLELSGETPLGIADYPQADVLYVISPFIQVDLPSSPIWEIKSVTPAKQTAAWEFPHRENVYKLERL